jgi:arylsulfatase A-like enzyme
MLIGRKRACSYVPTLQRSIVILAVLDDQGFSDLGCFGSGIATPVLDELAAGGVRPTGFHATPLCSPSRASIRASG